MANNEITNGERFIYANLTAREPLDTMINGRIYPDAAPGGVQYPLVVYRYSAIERTVLAVGDQRKMIPVLFIVFGVADAGNFAGELETIAGEIDAALSGKQGDAGDGYVYSAVRKEPYRKTEVIAGRYIRSLGWYYRLLIRAAGAPEV